MTSTGTVSVSSFSPASADPSAVCVQVDRQSPYVQGYRLFYRPSGGTWLLQDINSPSERSTILNGLLKGTEYEIKIRPYFDEFQGKDSRTLLIQTREEGNLLLSLIRAVCCVRLQGFIRVSSLLRVAPHGSPCYLLLLFQFVYIDL